MGKKLYGFSINGADKEFNVRAENEKEAFLKLILLHWGNVQPISDKMSIRIESLGELKITKK